MGQVHPPGVHWVQEACQTFDPERNTITLSGGEQLEYEVLIVAAGLQQNFDKIKGLRETLGKNGVASIYSYEFSPVVWQNILKTSRGTALFTNPATAVNCGGAPQKIAYLAESAWRSAGVRNQIDIKYFTPSPGVFACPYYCKALDKIMAEKGIQANVKTNLVEVDGENQLATFERGDGEIFTQKFDFLHVTPPMSAPNFLQDSGLTNASGFVDVDKETCQHSRYPNVFALGDCSSLPTSKTYSGISGQAPVVVHNVQSMLRSKPSEANAVYDGYTACPILTGDSKLMLAEFSGYTMEPAPTFWPLDQRVPRWLFYFMKRFVFERVYWHLMPIGRWFGKRTIFEPPLVRRTLNGGPQGIAAAASMVPPSISSALNADIAAPVGDGSSHGAEASSGDLKPASHVPGDISLTGSLPAEAVAALAPRYKGWLYLNPSDHAAFHAKEIRAAGCELENMHLLGGFSGGVPTTEHAEAILAAMARLPRPLMLQCTSGNRSGAALLLWLAKSTLLAQDMELKFYKCTSCGPVWEWLSQQVEQTSAAAIPQERNKFVVEQLFDNQGSSTFTYLLACSDTEEAVLIDPVLGMEERDLTLLTERGLKLKYIVNTHCHADHVTSGGLIKKLRPGVKTVISKDSGAAADIHLADKDTLEFGRYSLEAMATPGHTPGCMSFVLRGPGEPKAVFTGDTLLIRGCGRTDFQQGDAEQLYDSIRSRIFTLPDDTKVYPGHDYKGRNISTVKEEHQFNPRLNKGKAEFVRIMAGLNLPHPKLMDIAVPANLRCGEQD